jgi:hypothetical protein
MPLVGGSPWQKFSKFSTPNWVQRKSPPENQNLSLSLSLSLYIYIYIYIERERYIYIQRERGQNARARLRSGRSRAALKLGHSTEIGTFQSNSNGNWDIPLKFQWNWCIPLKLGHSNEIPMELGHSNEIRTFQWMFQLRQWYADSYKWTC